MSADTVSRGARELEQGIEPGGRAVKDGWTRRGSVHDLMEEPDRDQRDGTPAADLVALPTINASPPATPRITTQRCCSRGGPGGLADVCDDTVRC